VTLRSDASYLAAAGYCGGMSEQRGRHKLVVASAAVSIFLLSFDVNMVNIALPTITAHYSLDVATSAWLVIVYALVLCSLLLPFGRAGDVIGHRRLYIAGMALFSVANLGAGLSYHLDDFYALVLLRGAAGLGTAMMVSVNFAIVSVNLPEAVRGRGLGIFTVFGAVGFMTGPLASGLLISLLHWNWIFYTNAAIAAFGLALAVLFIPRSGGKGETADVAQTAALFIGLLCFVVAVNRVLAEGPSPVVMVSASGASVAALAVLHRQGHAARPLLERSLVRDPLVMIPMASMAFVYMAYSGSMVLLPFYLEYILGLTPAAMGLLFVLPALVIMTIGPLSGSFADRRGSYVITLAGTGLMVASMLVFTVMGRADGLLLASLGLLAMGGGHGLFNPPNNRRIFCTAPIEHIGTASGMHQMLRQVGMVIGAATMPALYQMVAGPAPATGMMLDGFQAGFALGMVFAVAAVTLALLTRRACRPR